MNTNGEPMPGMSTQESTALVLWFQYTHAASASKYTGAVSNFTEVKY